MSGTDGKARRRLVGITVGVAAFAGIIGLNYALADPTDPDASASQSPTEPSASALPTPSQPANAEASTSTGIDLDHPGDTELFARGLNIQIPWTADISEDILAFAAQDVCAELDSTRDPVAARNSAVASGFEARDTAPFVEQSVASFCPQLASIIPSMANP